MEFAIIAAGEGSRLKQEGSKLPKAMIILQELTLIERLINIFLRNKAEKIHVIINEDSPELSKHLEGMTKDVNLNILTKSTPSSLHSFYEILSFVKNEKICLATVDSVFKEAEFEDFIMSFHNKNDIDGLLAATSFIDDESPLYIATDDDLNITGFYDDNHPGNTRLISGGIYCLKSKMYPVVNRAILTGLSRMRNFQRLMITEGSHLKAFPFSKIIDIDHVTDIAKAETFLSNQG